MTQPQVASPAPSDRSRSISKLAKNNLRSLATSLAILALGASHVSANEPHSLKKGVGYAVANGELLQANVVHATNASWYYSWGIPTTRNNLVSPLVEFVPMKWGGGDLPSTTVESQLAARIAGLNIAGYYPVENFLGFNEPDHVEQSNMGLAELLGDWPSLENIAAPGALNIGSASMTGFHQLQQDFMAQKGNLKVDFMTFHQYPGLVSGVDTIMGNFQSYYAAYGKNIWLTEFNLADWAGTAGWTQEQAYSWMIEALYRMENSPIVTRYAVFPWDTTYAAGYASRIFELGPSGEKTATLTPLGELYSDYRTADLSGPYVATWYYLHNKASHNQLKNGPALDTIYLRTTAVDFSLVEAGNGNYFLVNRSSGNRLAYNGTTLSMAAPTVTDFTVQWSVSDSTNGWDYVTHVSSGKRLSGSPSLSMVAGTTTTDDVKWAFVRSHLAQPLLTSTVLVGGTTLNGNFDNPSGGATFATLANWVNLGTGASTMTATIAGTNANAYNGTPAAVLGYLPGTKVFGLNTGHTIVADERYDISYYWKDGSLWSDNLDQVRVSLFTTADNTITGARTTLVADLSGYSTLNNTYELVNHAGIYKATAADAGKTLFVAIDTTIIDEGYAHLDNFQLSVTSRPTPPAAPAFSSSTLAGTAATAGTAYTGTIGGTASDPDSSVLTYSRAVTGPKWLQVAADGTLSGTPGAGDVGVNTFVVQVHDGNGQVGNVDTATLTINVDAAGNLPPYFNNGVSAWSLNFTEDTYSNTFNSWRVTDPEGDQLTCTKVSGPSWVSVTLRSFEIRGTPAQVDVNQSPQTLVVDITDAAHPSSPIRATITLNIANVNDAPAFTVDPINGPGAIEGETYSGSVANATDVDPNDTLTYSKLSGPAWLSVAADGCLSGTPAAGDIGASAFTVQVADGNGGTDTAVLNLTVAANQAPAFTGGSAWSLNVAEDSFANISNSSRVSDPEGDVLTFTKVSGPAWATVTSGFVIQGTPTQADVNQSPQTLVVNIADALHPAIQATITLNVANVNDAPVFTIDPINGANATAGIAYAGTVANAADEDPNTSLTYSKVGGPAWLAVNADGSLSGTPGSGDVGANTFTVQVSDGSGGTGTATLNVSVVAGNQPPAFLYGSTWTLNFTEDTYTNTFNAWRVSDPDGDQLTLTKISGPSWVSVTLHSFEIRGTPTQADVNQSPQTLVVDITDGTHPPIRATITLAIANVNDVPAFTVEPINLANATGGSAYSGSIANATDPDPTDVLTYSKVSGPAWLTVNANGTVSGTPGQANLGLNTFTVQVSDGNGGTDTATLNITVVAPSNAVYVSNIAMTAQAAGGNKSKATAVITLLTNAGAPVSGATVTVQWSGDYVATKTGTTNTSGQVTFTTPNVANGRTYTITVTSVTGNYYPSLNVETTDTVIY